MANHVPIDDSGLERLRGALTAESFDDRFELGDETGRGGMGIVYRAVERETGRVLAVKILDDAVRDHTRFSREAAVLERLSHSAIVRYVRHGVTTDGRPYLAMEWLDGVSVAARLRGGAMPIADVVAMGARIAGALAHAHAQQILHRDLKPSNVILVDGDPARATLIDFGIAKDLQETTVTSTGQLVGTPAYMAPEQAAGHALDARTDLFALGCLLYECLVGKPPFEGTALIEVLAQVLMRSPQPAGQQRDDVPARLDAVVTSLLEKQPERRVGDASIVASELTAIAAALGAGDRAALTLPATPFRSRPADSQVTVADRPKPRRRRRVTGAASACALAGIVVVAIYVGANPSGSDPRDAPAPALPGAAAPKSPVELAPSDAPKRVPGPLLAPAFHKPPPEDQLGSWILKAVPCASRGVVALALADGRVVTIDRAGAVETLVRVPVRENLAFTRSSVAMVCLDSGKLLGVLNDKMFAIDGDIATVFIEAPPGKLWDGVAFGAGARWVGHGAVWEWDGTGTFTRVRATCPAARELAPDSTSVTCPEDGVVDNGKTLVKGLPRKLRHPRSGSRWSDDSTTLYMVHDGEVHGWRVGRGSPARIADGTEAVVAGSWLVTRDHDKLEWTWIGRGRRPKLTTHLDTPSARLLAAMPDSDQVVIAYYDVHLALATRGGTATPRPSDRHRGPIRKIAFALGGEEALATLGFDRQLALHSLRDGSWRRIGASEVSSADLLAGADGGFINVGFSEIEMWTPGGERTARLLGGQLGLVHGTTELIRATEEGIDSVTPAREVGERLLTRKLPELRVVAADRSKRYVLVDHRGHPELIDRQLGEVVVSFADQSGAAYLLDGTPVSVVFVDRQHRIAIATPGGSRPVVQLDDYTGIVETAPVGRRFAVARDNEVIVFDADRRVEIARGELGTSVLALAWSPDGRRLAAAAMSTELAVWDVP